MIFSRKKPDLTVSRQHAELANEWARVSRAWADIAQAWVELTESRPPLDSHS